MFTIGQYLNNGLATFCYLIDNDYFKTEDPSSNRCPVENFSSILMSIERNFLFFQFSAGCSRKYFISIFMIFNGIAS